MKAVGVSTVPSPYIPKPLHRTHNFFQLPNLMNSQSRLVTSWSLSSSSTHRNMSTPFKVLSIASPSSRTTTETTTDPPPEPELETETTDEKFDWFSHWYPVMPVCDLDKRVPHGKKILGLDIVVWWDKNESTWKVFDDACPHRLAPLSDGRIDKSGRLQCAYHGWCFNGSGDCKLIPQAPPDGPQVNTFKKACVGVYPSTVQNGIVWFFPSTDPMHKHIIQKKRPPFIPELDDPSFTTYYLNRDFPYGYEVLAENLMDPAHVPYAHYGIMQLDEPPKVKLDREGGKPLEISVKKIDKNGVTGRQGWGSMDFVAPCFYSMYADHVDVDQGNDSASSTGTADKIVFEQKLSEQRKILFYFFCIPVSPGNSRLIWGFTKNFRNWADNIIPQWIRHISTNMVVDSDLYLLHFQERKIMEAGAANWQKECFTPTKSDAMVVGFRRWLSKYSGGQINWGPKFSGSTLPPTPPREQLMDRYWSHVVNCRSCSSAYKTLKALEVILQVISIVSIGIVAATKQSVMSAAARTPVVSMAVVCFATSRWLAHFIYKTFHFHDYSHSLD